MPGPAIRGTWLSVPGFTFNAMTTIPAHPRQRPGRVARWRVRVSQPQGRTWFLYVPICFLSSMVAAMTWDSRRTGSLAVTTSASSLSMLVFLLGTLAGVSLVWRRRFPEAVVLVTCATALLLPLDPVPALVAFGSLLVRRLDPVAAGLGGLATVATFVSTWKDSRGTTTSTSWWQLLRGGETGSVHSQFSVWAVLAVTLVLVGVTVGIALLIRSRGSLSEAQLVVKEQRAVVDHLSDEVSRQADRERIAQEVHDALGHRLSLLSLHAGALEVTSGDDPRIAESAALVRANAQQSMADLRSLLAMLRTPDAPDVVAAVPTLGDVPALIDETVTTGVTIVSTVSLEGLARLDDTTSRSAFRITQELLTNARRHAPGIGVRVLVRAAPETGVVIEVANHLPREAALEFRPGSGIDGIRNRVLHLGGDFRCFVDEQRVFRVACRLPWAWSAGVGPTWSPVGEERQ